MMPLWFLNYLKKIEPKTSDKNKRQATKASDAEPKRGRWMPFHSEAAGDIQYCSACDVGFAHRTDFCPHCGADMREVDDD